MKSLDISTAKKARENISDIKIWGDGDLWELLCEASSDIQGWMKTTKAMEIKGIGVVIQTETQQRCGDYLLNHPHSDPSPEAVEAIRTDHRAIGYHLLRSEVTNVILTDTWIVPGTVWELSQSTELVPGATIREIVDDEGAVVGRDLVKA